MSGMENCIVAGGTEMMSLTAAMARDKMQAGIKPPMMGAYNERLQRVHQQSHQGICGDGIASMEGFTREDLDEVGYGSEQPSAAEKAVGRVGQMIEAGGGGEGKGGEGERAARGPDKHRE